VLIGELATATQVPISTLRYYERAGLLSEPARTRGGYRAYPPDMAARVVFIRQAQAAELTLKQIGEVLAIRDDGKAPCSHVGDVVDDRLEEIEHRLRELRRTREQLRDIRRRLSELDPADCSPADVCSAVG
jgi:DNA-binding transcriptional MerR regulator